MLDWGLIKNVALVTAQSLVLLVGLLIMVAFLLLFDRKVWAAVQMRRGPNVVGPFGLFQSFADLLKFVLKECCDEAVFGYGKFHCRRAQPWCVRQRGYTRGFGAAS
jgi:NADH:ubiquinone oxidoreductase subunit H